MKKKDYFLSYKEYANLNNGALELNDRVAAFASYGAMFLAFGAFITLSIVSPFSIIDILAGICVLNIVFNNLFAMKYFGPKIKKWSDVFCVGFLMLSMPIQWFGTGGFTGVGGMWIIFALVYCVFGVSGIQYIVLSVFFTIEVIVIFIVNICHPELVDRLGDTEEIIVQIVSIMGIGLFIQYVSYLQSTEFWKDRKQLKELSEDLNNSYEEMVSMNDELTKTTKRLEIVNKTQKSFTASVNHELRAPLNGIEGCLQILLMDETLSDESREMVRNALTASKTINETVNDLLDFAKLDEGKFEIVKKNFDLRDLLDNITTIFKPQSNAKNLNFVIRIAKDARVSIVADGIRIQQIITNIVSNAIKYTSEGTVELSVKTERGLLSFDVCDTGQGMDEESLKVLFDPFTRFNLEKNSKIQGTGLGMNVVSSLIKEMKGKIEVKSEVGVGSNFHVEIPIIFYDSSITYSTPREKENFINTHVDLSKYKVLCVDDTEINRTVFKGLLNRTGAYVVMADSGKKAISLCETQKFDIIFMDHIMPEMDGLEAIEEIRKIDEFYHSEVPYVMFTGNSGEEYQTMYHDAGAAGCLLKPIMFDELVKCFEYCEPQGRG